MPSEFENLQNQLASYENEVSDLYSSADRFLYDYELANYRNYRDNNPLHDQKKDLYLNEDGYLKEDSDWVKSLKSKYNNFVSSVFDAGDSYQFDIYDNGRAVSGANKNYDASGSANAFDEMDDNEFISYVKNVEEDPNAQNVLYSYRQYAGKDENGNDQYNYKVGYAKAGAWDRVKGNLASQGIELLWDKRFAGAEEYENSFHKRFLDNVAFDKGTNKTSGLNFNDGYTELYDTDILGVDENQSRDDTYRNANKSLEEGREYWKKHTGSDSIVDAVQYGAVRLGGDLIDLGSTSIGYVLDKLGVKNSLEDNVGDTISENAAKWVGYDMQSQTEATVEAIGAWNRGDYFDAVFNDLGAKANTMAESLPEMLLMEITTGGAAAGLEATRLAKKFVDAEKTLRLAKAVKDVKSVEKYTDEVNSLKKALLAEGADIKAVESLAAQSVTTALTKDVASQIGFNAVWAKNTNNVIEERKANGDDDISMGEFLAIAGSQFVLTGLDKVAFDEIVKVPEIKAAFKSAYDAAKGTKYESAILGKITAEAGKLAAATGEEGAQEYLQTWGEIFGKDVGVNGKTFEESFYDKENQDEAIGSMAMGAGAGFATSVASRAATGTLSAAGEAIGRLENLAPDTADSVKNATESTYKLAKSVGKLAKNTASSISSTMSQPSLSAEEIHDQVIKEYNSAFEKMTEDMDSIAKEKIARESMTAVRLSNHPLEVKKNILESMFKSEHLSNAQKDELYTKFAADAVRDVADLYKANKGSEVYGGNNSDPLAAIIGQQADQTGQTAEENKSMNPVKGKLGSIIESLDIAIENAKKDGANIDDLVSAKKIVEAYNTSDVFEKSLASVGSEVDIVGFVGDTGSILKPSLKQYEANLLMNTELQDDGFATASRLYDWSSDRHKKLELTNPDGTQRKGVYNFISKTGTENIRLANLADNVLKNAKNISDEDKKYLELASKNFKEATISDANEFVDSKRANGKKLLDEPMSPEETKSIKEKIRSARTASDANNVLYSMDRKFADPGTANEFMRMYSGIISKKGNPFLTVKPVEASLFIDQIRKGTLDETSLKEAISSGSLKGKDEELEYINHAMASKDIEQIDKVPDDLMYGIEEAESVDDLNKAFVNILNNHRLTYEAFVDLRNKTIRKGKMLTGEIGKSKDELINEVSSMSYPNDIRDMYVANKNSIDKLEPGDRAAFIEHYKNKLREALAESKREKELIALNKEGILTPEQAKKEGKFSPTYKETVGTISKKDDNYNDYDTRSIDAEIAELEMLKNRLNSMTTNDKDLSDADKVVLGNIRKSIQKEIGKVDKKIESYNRAKKIQEKKLKENNKKSSEIDRGINKRDESLSMLKKAVLKAIDAFKESIKRIRKRISALKKTRKGLEKIDDTLSSYIESGKADLRKRKSVVSEIDKNIEIKKNEKKEKLKKLDKETEESLRKKLTDDVRTSKVKDTSSLRSSVSNKLNKLAEIYKNQIKKIDSSIKEKIDKLEKYDLTVERVKTKRDRLEERYDDLYNKYKEVVGRIDDNIAKNVEVIVSEQKRISDIFDNMSVLAKKLKDKTISKSSYDKQIKSFEKRVEQHKSNIVKHKKYIEKQNDKKGDIEEKYLTGLRKLSSRLNDDLDGTKLRKQILEMEEKRSEIRAKTYEYVNAALVQKGEVNSIVTTILSDIVSAETSETLNIDNSLNAKIEDPKKIIESIPTTGSVAISKIKSEPVREHTKERKTILSRLSNLFTASRQQLLAWVKSSNIREEVIPSIENVSAYMSTLPEISIKDFNNVKFTRDIPRFENKNGNDFVSILSALGVTNEKIVEAVRFGSTLALMVYSSVRANMFSMNEKDLAEDFGLDEAGAARFKQYIAEGYIPMRTLETEISSIVMKRLGIELSKDVDMESYELLSAGIEAAIGASVEGLVTGINAGNMVQENVTGKNMHMIRMSTKRLGLWETYAEDFANINYINESSKRRPPKRTPYKIKDNETLVNSFIELNDKHRADVEKNNNTKYYFNSLTKEFVDEYKAKGTEALKRFGYKDITDDMSIEEMMLAKAHNEKYIREADTLVRHYEYLTNPDGTVSDFYVPWGVTKSERMTIRSDLNIQESKMHRTFVVTKDYESTVNVNEPVKDLVQIGKSTSLTETEMFEVALAQSFGMDPDKNSQYGVFKSIRSNVNIYGDKIEILGEGEEWDALRKFINREGDDNENLSVIFDNFEGAHSVHAALELRRLNESDNKESFKTTLYIEADGITSGPALLNMKILGEHQLEMLEKAGVYTNQSKKKLEKYTKYLIAKKHGIEESDVLFSPGALIEAGKYHIELVGDDIEFDEKGNITVAKLEIEGERYPAFLDLYTTVGQYANEARMYIEAKTDDSGRTILDKLGKVAKTLYNRVFEKASLKDMRTLSKDPTMTYGYGAMISSIQRVLTRRTYIKSIVDIMRETGNVDILSKVIRDYTFKNELKKRQASIGKEKLSDKDIAEISKIANKAASSYMLDPKNYIIYDKKEDVFREPDEKELQEIIKKREQVKYIQISSEVEDNVHQHYSKRTVGSFYKKALDKAFGAISEMRDGFKAVDLMVSGMFNAKLKVRLDAIRKKKGYVSKKNFLEEVIKLHESGFGHSLDNPETRQPLYKYDTGSKVSTRDFEEIKIGNNTYRASVTPTGVSFVSNSGAAVTISIHSLDGSVMQDALRNNDFTNIYDAVLAGLNQDKLSSATDIYNESWIKKSLQRQDFKHYVEKMDRMLSSLSDEELVAFYDAIKSVHAEEVNVKYDSGKVKYAPLYRAVKQNGSFVRVPDKSIKGDATYTVAIGKDIKEYSFKAGNGMEVARVEISKNEEGDTTLSAEIFIIKKDGKFGRAENGISVNLGQADIDSISADDIVDIVSNKAKDTFFNTKKDKVSDNIEFKLLTSSKISSGIKTSIKGEKNWEFLGQTIPSIFGKIKDAVFVVNSGIEYFNKNVDTMYSAQMFVTGTPIKEVQIKNTTNRPKIIEPVSDDASSKMNALIALNGADARKYMILTLRDIGISDQDIASIISEFDFNTSSINKDISEVIENIVNYAKSKGIAGDAVDKIVNMVISLYNKDIIVRKQEIVNENPKKGSTTEDGDPEEGNGDPKEEDNSTPRERVVNKFKEYFDDKTKGCP